jgi:hypothetical protein
MFNGKIYCTFKYKENLAITAFRRNIKQIKKYRFKKISYPPCGHPPPPSTIWGKEGKQNTLQEWANAPLSPPLPFPLSLFPFQDFPRLFTIEVLLGHKNNYVALIQIMEEINGE